MPRVLVDANIFLELELEQSKSGECKAFLRRVASGNLEAVTTDFVLDSVAAVMEDRSASPDDIKRFLSSLLFYKGLVIHNLGLKGRIQATEEMEKSKLDFDDATSVAAMRKLGLKDIISLDSDFDRVSDIRRIDPKTALSLT